MVCWCGTANHPAIGTNDLSLSICCSKQHFYNGDIINLNEPDVNRCDLYLWQCMFVKMIYHEKWFAIVWSISLIIVKCAFILVILVDFFQCGPIQFDSLSNLTWPTLIIHFGKIRHSWNGSSSCRQTSSSLTLLKRIQIEPGYIWLGCIRYYQDL